MRFFLFLFSVWVAGAAHAAEIVKDVSGQNLIAVEQILQPTSTKEVQELVRGHAGPICIGGGRYSQGGQIATDQCLFLDMRGMSRILALDVANHRITVQAGIRWRAIQEAIDPHDLSLRIMQSFSNFTVGGSLSVNAHGRYVGEGPLVGSVESIKIVLADGSLKEASRTVNRDLFDAAIGGYGGIGVITEATLNLTDNSRIIRHHQRMPLAQYRDYYFREIRDAKEAVFHSAYLYPPNYTTLQAVSWFRTDNDVTVSERLAPIRPLTGREQFMLSWLASGPYGKQLRRHVYDPFALAKTIVQWRNYEASYDLLTLEPRSREKNTDLLQEYFIPVAKFEDFVPKMAEILKSHQVNVLNVSVRHTHADKETLLAWAPQEMFAFVIYYRQPVGEEAKQSTAIWTRALVDAALAEGGSYYMPYQIAATREQFLRAYVRAPEFFALKARIDPTNKFRNQLWDHYYRAPR